MADILLVLGIATFLHYFGIFTFHSIHYWVLLFLLSTIEFFFYSYRDKIKETKKRSKNDNRI